MQASGVGGVKESGLEYTRFSRGACMNMLGTGTSKDDTEATAGMRSWS